MSIKHRKVSPIPPGGNPGDVTTSDWNDTHVSTLDPLSYSADSVLPATVEVVLGTGGVSGITLTIPSAVANKGMKFWAMKVDTGVGLVAFIDAASANFLSPGGSAGSYVLPNQGVWVLLVSDGTQWLAFGV